MDENVNPVVEKLAESSRHFAEGKMKDSYYALLNAIRLLESRVTELNNKLEEKAERMHLYKS